MNQPEVKQPDIWTFFDKIYCISLDKRIDRREQAKKQFAQVGSALAAPFLSQKQAIGAINLIRYTGQKPFSAGPWHLFSVLPV